MEFKNTTPPPISSSLNELIKYEKIGYNCSITVTSNQLTEVFHYSREFITKKDYNILIVKLSIPFTGNNTQGKRSRILLYLDDEIICDGTMYNEVHWELKPLFLEGIGINVKSANHKLKLMCCVDGGELNIPHYNPGCIEHTIKPEISGRLIILGFN